MAARRPRPVITVVDARPMSEISFRGEVTSPKSTSPGVANGKPTVKSGSDRSDQSVETNSYSAGQHSSSNPDDKLRRSLSRPDVLQRPVIASDSIPAPSMRSETSVGAGVLSTGGIELVQPAAGVTQPTNVSGLEGIDKPARPAPKPRPRSMIIPKSASMPSSIVSHTVVSDDTKLTEPSTRPNQSVTTERPQSNRPTIIKPLVTSKPVVVPRDSVASGLTSGHVPDRLNDKPQSNSGKPPQPKPKLSPRYSAFVEGSSANANDEKLVSQKAGVESEIKKPTIIRPVGTKPVAVGAHDLAQQLLPKPAEKEIDVVDDKKDATVAPSVVRQATAHSVPASQPVKAVPTIIRTKPPTVVSKTDPPKFDERVDSKNKKLSSDMCEQDADCHRENLQNHVLEASDGGRVGTSHQERRRLSRNIEIKPEPVIPVVKSQPDRPPPYTAKIPKPERPPPCNVQAHPGDLVSAAYGASETASQHSENEIDKKPHHARPPLPNPQVKETKEVQQKGPPPRPAARPKEPSSPPSLPARPTLGHPLFHYVVQGPHALALYDYSSTQADELSFSAGDIIMLEEWINSEWLKGTCGKGRIGMFPANFVEIVEPLPTLRPVAASYQPTTDSWDAPSSSPSATGITGPHCIARFDYDASEPDDLSFAAGDVIRLTGRINSEWLRGELRGNSGVFPLSFVEVIEDLPVDVSASAGISQASGTISEATDGLPYCIAVYDFTGESNEDLSFSVGDRIVLLSRVNAEWLKGSVHGREGMFPSAFVNIVDGLSDLPPRPNAAAMSRSLSADLSAAGKQSRQQTTATKTTTTSEPNNGRCKAVAVFDFDGDPAAGDLTFLSGETICDVVHDPADISTGSSAFSVL